MSTLGKNEIPQSWIAANLEDVVEILDYIRVPINQVARNIRIGNIPYYGATGQVGWIDKALFDEELVLLGEDGAPFLDQKKTKAYLIEGKSWVNNHAHVLRGEKGFLNRFLLHQLNFTNYHEFISGTTRLKLPQARMRAMPLVVAPTKEQQRIVTEIEKQFARLDEAVAALKRVSKDLKQYRAAVLKAACEGRLVETEAELARRKGRAYESASELLQRILKERRAKWEFDQLAKMKAQGKEPQDDKWRAKYIEPQEPQTSNLLELPEGWVWVTPPQLGAIQLGRQRSPRNRSKDHPTKYIRAANITEDGLDLTDVLEMEFTPDERKRYQLKYGDIILSEASGSPKQVGKPAVWRDELPLCCFQNTVIKLRPTLDMSGSLPEPWRKSERKETLDISDYLLQVFKHYYLNGIFTRISSGVGINHLSADRFSAIKVPLPPLAEQKRIVEEVEKRLRVVDELEDLVATNLESAEDLRRAILKRAFEGRLVPQDPTDEPASVLLERIAAQRQQREIKASISERLEVDVKSTKKLWRDTFGLLERTAAKHQRRKEEAMKEKPQKPPRRANKKEKEPLPALFAEPQPSPTTLLPAFELYDELSTDELFTLTNYIFDEEDRDVEAFFAALTAGLESKQLEYRRTPYKFLVRRHTE